MYYNFAAGIKHNKGIFSTGAILSLIGVIVAVGAYVTINCASPMIFAKNAETKQTIDSIARTEQPSDAERIMIPTIGVDAPIYDRYSGDGVLRKGALLSAKRLTIGLTPQETMRQSPLYHLADIKPGDQVFVDSNGKRMVYEVTGISDAQVSQITSPQTDLAIYSYDDSGKATLVTLQLVGTMEWQDGRAGIVAN